MNTSVKVFRTYVYFSLGQSIGMEWWSSIKKLVILFEETVSKVVMPCLGQF